MSAVPSIGPSWAETYSAPSPSPLRLSPTATKRKVAALLRSIDCGDPRCDLCGPLHERRRQRAHERACGIVRIDEGATDLGSIWSVEPPTSSPARVPPRRPRPLTPTQVADAHALIAATPIRRCYDRDAWEVEVWRELTEPTITVIRHERGVRLAARVKRAINRAQRALLARSMDLRVQIDRGRASRGREEHYAIPASAGDVEIEIGDTVRIRRAPGVPLRDLIPRWRVVTIEGSEAEIEDTEDGSRRAVPTEGIERC